MLLQAAERTPGLKKTPPPFVLQTALADFYVEYTACAYLEKPEIRIPTLAVLHANIQDVFNEYGVQIMSPHYESDPAAPVVVPRAEWHAAPAAPGSGAGAEKPS
jgi:small-conductance mechanosensitive channel